MDMEENKIKQIELKTKLEFYKKLDKKLEKVLNGELDVQKWSDEVFDKINKFEKELDDLNFQMYLTKD